jgi:hypothetical protein
MSRKWIAATAVAGSVAATAIAAAVVFGLNQETRPAAATVEVALKADAAGAGRHARALGAEQAKRPKKAKKAKVLYFSGPGQVPATVGNFIDLKLTTNPPGACPRVIGGGAIASNTDVYQQGTSVGPDRGEYHVYLAFSDGATPVDFDFASHLICLKGVK